LEESSVSRFKIPLLQLLAALRTLRGRLTEAKIASWYRHVQALLK
jgi:hypothetical protein